MNKVKDSLKLFLTSYTFETPKFPMISCANDDSVKFHDFEYICNIIRKPIKFTDAIKKIPLSKHTFFVDFSATGTLVNFVKYNLESQIDDDCFSYVRPGQGFIRNRFLSA